jgi:hypothetical protein
MRVSGFENVPGAPGNIAGSNFLLDFFNRKGIAPYDERFPAYTPNPWKSPLKIHPLLSPPSGSGKPPVYYDERFMPQANNPFETNTFLGQVSPGMAPIGNIGGMMSSLPETSDEVAGLFDGLFGKQSKPKSRQPQGQPKSTIELLRDRNKQTEDAIKEMRNIMGGGRASSEINPFETLLAQNQESSSLPYGFDNKYVS